MSLQELMDRRVSVVIPSTGRLARLQSCVERLWATTRGFDVECIVVTDDHETWEWGREAVGRHGHGLLRMLQLADLNGTWRPRALEAWNLGAAWSTGAVLVLGADDLWWFHGWIGEMMETMAEFPEGEGMVGFNDLAHDGNKLSTHFAVGREFARQYLGGVLVCPKYHHFYVDQEAGYRAKAANRFVWAQNAVVEHVHPDLRKASTDELYERTRGFLEADKATFFERARLGWPDDFQPVIVRADDHPPLPGG